MLSYAGSCHCGAVTFTVTGDVTQLTTCNCSLCRKKNALMARVHEDNFTMTADWDTVSLYQWNMKIAKHYFCKTCGIYTFHRKRSEPDHFGVNAQCLDGLDIAAVDVKAMDGISMSVTQQD
ncbi:GFA family protein [uncultured Litoreibacter sp.]|uniref:GFA family protein n=1 Tax=uncultured Litoreibacter sp. TaxID=1392394 RepID=UPI00260D4C8C|nr:GFA family protein [uncultured Litoreibacter sp.]